MAGGKSPWSALNDQAADGNLEFDSSVAYDAAELAASTIGSLLAIKEVAKDIDEPKAVSSLASGEALGKKLAQKGTDISDVLDKHVGILEDMIETFKTAGKAYDGAEADSRSRFDDITIPDRPGELSSKPPVATSIPGEVNDEGKYDVDKYLGGPEEHEAHEITGQRDRLKSHGKFEPSMIMGENADAQSYGDLYQLGQSISNHSTAQRAANWSGKWYWMAEQTRTAFGDLVNNMDSITADQWKGAGKQAAVAAIKGYAESVPELAKNMNLIGDNLLYTAGWLEATRVSMPQEKNNPAGEDVIHAAVGYGGVSATYTLPQEDPTPQYRQNMRDTYLKGLPNSADRVPTLPSPAAAFSNVPNFEHKPAGQNPAGNPGNPGGSPQPTGGTPGGPSGQGGIGGGGGAPAPAPSIGAPPSESGGAPGSGRNGQQAAEQQATQIAAQQRTAQQEAAKQQAQQQKQQQQQQKQQEQQQAMQQGQQVAQQASQMAQQLGQQLSSAAQQQMAGGMPRAALEQAAAAKAAGLGDPKAGGGGGAGGGGAPRSSPVGAPPTAQTAETAKLFPRSEPPPAAGGVPRAGAAPMGATPGTPGPAGAAGRPAGGGGNEQEHRRPAYLDSTEHLEEALGDAPQVVRPVVER